MLWGGIQGTWHKKGQKFALRLMQFKCDELNAYTEASSMLIKEATDMSRAQHKRILEVCGVCIHPNKGFALVLPHMSRGSLEQLLLREPDTISHCKIRILLQIADGMLFLHGLNPQLLHLDLKPANVLFTDNLDVKVSDFGLSRARRLMTAPRTDTPPKGSLEYIPPEHLEGYKSEAYYEVWCVQLWNHCVASYHWETSICYSDKWNTDYGESGARTATRFVYCWHEMQNSGDCSGMHDTLLGSGFGLATRILRNRRHLEVCRGKSVHTSVFDKFLTICFPIDSHAGKTFFFALRKS